MLWEYLSNKQQISRNAGLFCCNKTADHGGMLSFLTLNSMLI